MRGEVCHSFSPTGTVILHSQGSTKEASPRLLAVCFPANFSKGCEQTHFSIKGNQMRFGCSRHKKRRRRGTICCLWNPHCPNYSITLYTKKVALYVPLLENIKSIFNIHTKIQREKLSKLTANNKQSLN